ncbi:unnamed protein product [Heligmosomoides polygyrus]|uniref:Uncharacterized protein n=1 Tax=Heligmosomoides polygyrus TaxID=6339 RepID=A0A3P8FAV1_HELPZ|nr:unnamed protein product [Heligmosomoides polygyrus]
MISVSKFHRLSGYVDDEAKNRQTFCAMHEITKDIHVHRTILFIYLFIYLFMRRKARYYINEQ